MTRTNAETDSSGFDALLREAARQSDVRGGLLLHAGKKLSGGRFEILRRIGEGGMGVVYEAFDAVRRERVALKTMSRLEAGDVYRLKNEFRALADVSHPNLVRLHELCADGALWCFTMELVQGERFDRWVRPRGGDGDRERQLDESRLRRVLPALVAAIGGIHAAGKLHRDLKPSNVLVTAEGRVVVLDFGLAIAPEAGAVGQTVADDNVSGTPGYMAPEQAAGQAATAASDFYALGAMLFEALTGRLPFEGSSHAIIVDKQRLDAPPTNRFAPEAPPDLAELCARLLAREPSARPDAGELRALFPQPEERTGSSRSSGSYARSASGERGISHAPASAPELLGREEELLALRDAFDATLRGQAVVVLVSGESGMGKSALCEAFLHELRAQGRATVLAGRCYERENVPFKGLDSLVDDLTRHLRKLSREEAIAVLPREVHALTRLFPVLGRVEVVAEAPRKDVLDPLEQRRRAYAAFGEFMTRVRDRTPLCVHLDDVQWLDTDAVLFLRALLVQPEPVPGLLLLSHRSEGAENNPALLRVRDAIEGNSHLELRTLSVDRLSAEAARDLARRLLPETMADAGEAASAVARESAGSPFFVGELSRFIERHAADPGALERLSLGVALGDHLSALPPPARRLLEAAALAGKPLPAKLLLDAAEATHTELDLLRASRSLRFSSLEGDPIVDCYHDKVRESVAGGLDALGRVASYAALARALEAHDHLDSELLATCFEGAGQHASAAEHYARAAGQALAGTAFVHAAGLYEKALALGRFEPAREQALCVAQGDALAQAGRGMQAAELFLRAARGADGAASRDLRRRAAEELGVSGHAGEAKLLFRELFAEVGLTFPSSPGATVRRLLFADLRLRFRGINYVARAPSDCSSEDREVLAMYQSAHAGLSIHTPLLGACFDFEHLLRALAAGVPEQVARGLAYSAYHLSLAQPSADRITRMLDTALRIAGELGDLRLSIETEAKAGFSLACRGLWRQSRGHHARALELMRSNVRDTQSWQDMCQAYDLPVAFLCGDWLDVTSTAPGLGEQGYSRDRIWIAALMSGNFGMVAWLARDDVAGYERVLARARERWRPDDDAQWPDYALTLGGVGLHLYRGDSERALAAIEPVWAWLRRSIVARAQLAVSVALHSRGMAGLAVLRATGDRAARTIARDSAKRLSRLELGHVPAMRSTLDAGLALHARDLDRAAAHLRAAVTGFEASDMPMYAAAARRRLGELISGDEGKALLAAGDAVLHAQRVVNLDAITEMLCAGCRAP